MAVSLRVDLPPGAHAEMNERAEWLKGRIPTKEFHINYNRTAGGDDYWDDDYYRLMAEISIWADDADRVATEFWFKFL